MTWAGRKVSDARAYWAPLLPLPCWRCRQPVLPEHRWQVEHIHERAAGGAEEGVGNQWVSHGRCNESAGGKLGGKRRAARAAERSARRREERPLRW